MPEIDGRRQRRDRNRWAVVEALLELIREGEMAPSADAVAARAGLSTRSVFRYFDDLDDLCRAGIARQMSLVGPILRHEIDPQGPLPERVAAVVAQRVGLFEAMGSIGTFARLRAPFQPLVAGQLTDARAVLRERLGTVLGPDLADRDPPTVATVLAAADVLCSFESFRLLRDDHGRSTEEATRVMTAGVQALLGTGAATAPMTASQANATT